MRYTVILAALGAAVALSACTQAEPEAPAAAPEEVAEVPAEPALVIPATSAETDYVGPGALRMKLGLKRGEFKDHFSQTAGVKLMPTIKVQDGWAYGPAQVAGKDAVVLWKQDGNDWPAVALTYGDLKGDFKSFCGKAPAGLIPDCA